MASTPRACAIPAQTPAITRSSALGREGGQRHAGSSYGALDAQLAGADVGVEHEHACSRVSVDALVDVAAVVRCCRGRSTSPNCASPCTCRATSGGTITSSSPTSTRASTCVSPAGSCTSLRSRRKLADAELVVVPQVLECPRRRSAVADAAAEVDVDDGGEDRRGDEHERDERAERDRDASANDAADAARVLRRRAPPASVVAGSPFGPCRVIQRIAAPAIRSTNQASPCGHSVACESRTAPATATSPSPISGQGRSRRLRSAAVANESSSPSSGMTSAAAR